MPLSEEGIEMQGGQAYSVWKSPAEKEKGLGGEPSSCDYVTESGVIFRSVRRASSVLLIKSIVKEIGPMLIVEFGHARAGLTAILRDAAPKAYIRAFDMRTTPQISGEQMAVFDGHVGFIQADIFEEGMGVVLNYLAWPNRKLLYCDNGDKTKEVMTFAQHLGKGDFLGVHDWTEGNPPTDAHAKVLRPWLKERGFVPHRHGEFEKVNSTSRFWRRHDIR